MESEDSPDPGPAQVDRKLSIGGLSQTSYNKWLKQLELEEEERRRLALLNNKPETMNRRLSPIIFDQKTVRDIGTQDEREFDDAALSAWTLSERIVEVEKEKPKMAECNTSICSWIKRKWEAELKPRLVDTAVSPIHISEDSESPTPMSSSVPSPPSIKREQDLEIIEIDWKESKVYKHVKQIMNLPANGRRRAVIELEKQFLDPQVIDIFSESEASYNAMLLR